MHTQINMQNIPAEPSLQPCTAWQDRMQLHAAVSHD
jgi:hypothetical protein